MASSFRARKSVPADLSYLPAIEESAAALFRSVPAVAYFADGGPSLSLEKQADLCAAGTLWVVTEQPENEAAGQLATPCAFLAAEKVDSSIHILELSVRADVQRRGLAGLLISAVSDYAVDVGLNKVSLVTEQDVPWNGPMYRRKGFKEVDHSELGPGHLRIVEHGMAQGMDMSRRAAMVLDLHR